jgi:hypothetical protein
LGWEYALPTMPPFNDAVVILRLGAETVNASDTVTVAPELSFTAMEKTEVPTTVGVPLSAPPADRVSPAGRNPVASENVYGAVPPDGMRDCE